MSYEHDLKPCPWCGGEADAPDGPYGRPIWVYEARCTVCHALGAQADTKADVVNAWNCRPAEDALRARAEAAEQRAEALAAELAQARADLSQAHGFLAECHKQLDELEGILSDALAARARAEAEVERLRTVLGGA